MSQDAVPLNDVIHELEDATHGLQAVHARVESANGALRHQLDGARALAAASRARLAQVREHWESELESARAHLAHVRTSSEAKLHGLEVSLGAASEHAHTLGDLAGNAHEHAHTFTAHVTAKAHTGHDSLTEHLEAVEQAFAAVEKAASYLTSGGAQAMQAVHHELTSWVSQARQHSHQLVEAMGAFEAHGHSRSRDVAQKVHGASEGKAASFHQHLQTGPLSRLGTLITDLHHGLEQLGLADDEHGGHLIKDIEDALAVAQKVIDLIKPILPVLEHIRDALA